MGSIRGFDAGESFEPLGTRPLSRKRSSAIVMNVILFSPGDPDEVFADYGPKAAQGR
jgi:hypothetical protein